MRRLRPFRVLLGVLLLGACATVPSPAAFPPALRGAWAETPAECAAPQVLVSAAALSTYGSLCRLESAAPATGGAVLANMHCTRPDGSATDELGRLVRQGDRLQLQVGDARLVWTRCG